MFAHRPRGRAVYTPLVSSPRPSKFHSTPPKVQEALSQSVTQSLIQSLTLISLSLIQPDHRNPSRSAFVLGPFVLVGNDMHRYRPVLPLLLSLDIWPGTLNSPVCRRTWQVGRKVDITAPSEWITLTWLNVISRTRPHIISVRHERNPSSPNRVPSQSSP